MFPPHQHWQQAASISHLTRERPNKAHDVSPVSVPAAAPTSPMTAPPATADTDGDSGSGNYRSPVGIGVRISTRIPVPVSIRISIGIVAAWQQQRQAEQTDPAHELIPNDVRRVLLAIATLGWLPRCLPQRLRHRQQPGHGDDPRVRPEADQDAGRDADRVGEIASIIVSCCDATAGACWAAAGWRRCRSHYGRWGCCQCLARSLGHRHAIAGWCSPWSL